MKVFIDTNILLDIYQMSGPDLEELKKLNKIIRARQVELLMPQHVLDEFFRNRERVIADALKTFSECKAVLRIPNIIRSYEETADLRAASQTLQETVKLLQSKVMADIEGDRLKADEVIRELFLCASKAETTEEIYVAATRRAALGNPPGKKNSIGDAINWEWLLNCEVEFWGEDLIIISSDSDYESELKKDKPREFLEKEWNKTHPGSNLKLYKSLTKFLFDHFPDIQLSEEVGKEEEILKLEQSNNFAATHIAVAALEKHDDFSDTDILRIIKAYAENNQILWILGDDDVKAFAKRIVSLARTERTRKAAEPLVRAITTLEPKDDDDDDLPF